MCEAKRKRKALEKNPRPCAICGERDAVDFDHVPPRSIFARPHPSNLITVPACFECNQGASQLDEQFKMYLGVAIGGHPTTPESDPASNFWGSAQRSILRNRPFLREIVNGEPVYVPDKLGVWRETRAIHWPAESYDLTIERIVRGLYWHHYDCVLGSRVPITSYLLKSLDDNLLEMAQSMRGNSIGNGAFVYSYTRAIEDQTVSIWLLEFYQSFWSAAFTGQRSKELLQNL